MRIKRSGRVIIVICILLVFSYFIEVDYYLTLPSRTVDLSKLILVENAVQHDEGAFFLVTVTNRQATLLTVAYGYFHPHIDLYPKSQFLPDDINEEEYRQLQIEYMIESRHIAQVVALRRVGYEVDILSDGVQVIGFTENAPSQGFLKVDDTILAVEGEQVYFAYEISSLLSKLAVGDEVSVTVKRDGREIDQVTPTGPHPEDAKRPFLGIYIKTISWEPIVPVPIIMETGAIGGPSAGLMFVLEIMNQLTSEDLTAGQLIAGTGTVDLNENVGKVGGVTQKVIAAEKYGARYFFVPDSNYDEAKKVARNIELVPVETLEDALEYLARLRKK